MPYKEVWMGEGENGYWQLVDVPDPLAPAPAKAATPKMSGTELVAYMQKNNMSPAQAATATGIPEGSILSSVAKTISPNQSLTLGGTTIQPEYSSRGEGDTFEQGPLSQILVYKENQGTGDPYKTYSVNGEQTGSGKFKDVGGLGQMLKETVVELAPVILTAATAGGGAAALGSALGFGTGAAATALGNAVIGGTLAEAQGGDFLKGALAAGAGSAIGAAVAPIAASVSEAVGSQALGQALTSGALAELQGGDFLQGAIQGGISGAINDAKLDLANQYIDSVEPGIGYDDLTSPTELDVLDAYPELASQPVFDAPFVSEAFGPSNLFAFGDLGTPTLQELLNSIQLPEPVFNDVPEASFVGPTLDDSSFQNVVNESTIDEILPSQPVFDDVPELVITAPRPSESDLTQPNVDYSLFSNAPVLSDMGAQGIQVPTINEIVDVVNQPVNYDLPVVDSGLGFEFISTPNLNEMGGGQGLTVPAAELPPYIAPDTSFTPDYGLNLGAPVLPEMGAQGIQVPEIADVVDLNQPVDYSLTIPDSGLGLVMPTAPNLDSMGGGQGLVVPVDGGVITESGFVPDVYVPILGDPNSFINQPAPNVEVSTETPAEKPKDISSDLALLDVIKAISPIVLGVALNNNANQSSTEQQSGYPILPIPSEWEQPEYGTAFTPSAPIDFGSRNLLKGTQWDNPAVQPRQMDYNLSDVINTLNFQSVPFVQQPMPQSFTGIASQPTPGINNIIGELNGKPVSLSDIISGIQSQYGQKAAS